MSTPDPSQPSHQRQQNPYITKRSKDLQDDTTETPRLATKTKRTPPKSTLYDWIKPKITGEQNSPSNQSPDHNSGNCQQKREKTTKPPQFRHHHQQQLNLTHNNDQWGDTLSSSPNIFCIASKNVNTLSPDDNLLQWRGVAHAMGSFNVNTLTIQEPNTKWTDHLQHRVKRIFQQTFRRAALSTSNSTEPSNTYQPGGTALTLVGPHATRLITSGQDTSGMGCWSYIELHGKHNKRLVIASAYCVRSQKARIGSNTVSTQQTQILLRSGQQRPQPCNQLINDLIEQIRQWQITGHEILVCLDVNEDTANPDPETGYGKLLHATGLIDLHRL